jgi:nucleoid DNA-binding protein
METAANMRTITKADLAKDVEEKTQISYENARRAIDALVTAIHGHFMSGRRIEIRGFGTFYPHPRQRRPITVPIVTDGTAGTKIVETGESIILKFRPSKYMVRKRLPEDSEGNIA